MDSHSNQTSHPNLSQLAYSQHDWPDYSYATNMVNNSLNQHHQFTQPLNHSYNGHQPSNTSADFPAQSTSHSQASHHQGTPTYYSRSAAPYLQVDVGANSYHAKGMYRHQDPHQESQLPHSTSTSTIQGSTARGGYPNVSICARGQGCGHGITQAQHHLILETTSSQPSLKQLLHEFLPKSLKVTPEVAMELKELMKKAALKQTSAAKMRVVAKKYTDGTFFMALEEDLEMIRVIYCILRRISPEQAARHIGEFRAMQDATLWNGLQASPEGQDVVLSDLWDKKTVDKKLTYRQYVCKSKHIPLVLLSGSNGQTKSYQPTEDLSDSVQPTHTGGDNWVAFGRSLATAHKTAKLWLADTQVQAKRIAQLTHSTIIILWVSSFLGPNLFQMFGGSLRGLTWLKLHQDRYGVANYNSEFQSFCTGVAVENLNTPGIKAKKSITYPKQDQACTALKDLLKNIFPMQNYSWPWVNCEGQLLHWGSEIVLHPGATTQLSCVTQQSKNLTDKQSNCISTDIAQGRFELAEVPKDSSNLKPRASKKRNNEEDENDQEEDHNDNDND
ncbi:hypothetical protein DFH28DRAFT_1082166 [Melampsora americana]|nr:hypothetical protein DFH28DRAFT_1082166 [Melampsora americana]